MFTEISNYIKYCNAIPGNGVLIGLLNGLKIKVIYYIALVSSEHTIFSCMYVVHVITYLEAFAESLRGDKSAQEEIIISSN